MSETQSNNIIQFPKEKINRVLPNGINSMEEVELYSKRISAFRKLITREYVSTFVPILFNQFVLAGFDMQNVHTSTEAALIVESIKSFIDKQLGIEHPFQSLSQQLFKLDSETDIMMFNENNGIIKKEEEVTENKEQ